MMFSKRIWTALTAVLCLSLTAKAGIIFSDSFSYADGALVTNRPAIWNTHSGTANQVDVTAGVLNLTGAETEDVNALIGGGPYSTNAAPIYAKFTVNFSELPGSGNAYFAHFKDSTTSGFRGRVFATVTGADAGSFRLGIGNGGTSTEVPTDLSLNTAYTIVLKLGFAGGNSDVTLWIDPTDESDPGTVATDSQNVLPISTFAFRQANGIGTLKVDNLVVATSFSEAVSAPPYKPVSLLEPADISITAGQPITLNSGAAAVPVPTYQWYQGDSPILNATNFNYVKPVSAMIDSGTYYSVANNAAGSSTSRVATVTVNAANIAPVIQSDPVNVTTAEGTSAVFTVGVNPDASAPLSYQWYFLTPATTNAISDATNATLTLDGVTTDSSGGYQVVVTNVVGSATSLVASLTVTSVPPATIASLHAYQDDMFALTNTASYFTVEAIVTSHVDLTGLPNALFYIQDSTAGIAVFWSGNGDKLPKAGDRVRVHAKLSQFNGLLELGTSAADPNMTVTVLSSNNPLPVPVELQFGWATDPASAEANESRYLVASKVFLDVSAPTFVSGATFPITNEFGQTFTLFVNAQTDIVGQSKPTGPVTIYGVLGQFDTSNPRTEGYQLIPTRFADIISATKAPTVRFTNYLSNLVRPGDLLTNTYMEHALRPGERLDMEVRSFDPDGKTITVTPVTDSLPASASWSLSGTTGTSITGSFSFVPTPDLAGSNVTVTLLSYNDTATNTAVWQIYVPTVAEQGIVISEFLANPATSDTSPYFNPLRRVPPSTNPSQNDEYIELVNLSPADIDLLGWTVSDAVGVRQQFGDTFLLSSSNSVVIHGGTSADSGAPDASFLSTPATTSAGLALNNTGQETIPIRNYPDGYLVARVVYTQETTSTNGSVQRFPTLNDPFVPQSFISTNLSSPGFQFNGELFTAAPPNITSPNGMVMTYTNGVANFDFPGNTGKAVTLWRSDDVAGHFGVISGGTFTNATGSLKDTSATNMAGFYFISTQ